MSIEVIPKSSNCRQPVKEPPCEADCQILVSETSKQINPDNDGSLQSNFVKSSSPMSGFSNSEIQKECSTPGKFATDQACMIGQESLDEFKREIVGETSKLPDDGVSELKLPGGGINSSPDNITGGCTEVPSKDVNDQVKSSFQDVSNNTKCEQLGPILEDKRKYTNNDHQKVVVLALKSAGDNCNMTKSKAKQKASYQKKSGMTPNTLTPNGSSSCRSSGRRQRGTPETSEGQRSNIKEKSAAIEHDSQLENTGSGKKRGRKKKQRDSEINDEFSRMRVHLRYLLHRIRYEQNLLDAYSSEGWRGQSLEKIRPEKELERAKSDINRSKLKIRALFQRLDEVCAEGQFPKSLFDEEGLVDSEDIFCAKCGCKDLSPNNDIILCDGACDRGFHQLCLDPPLHTEEIPPGDEGWYCPACDCKFDCVEILNDSMGTKLSMSHKFERVFPEATAKSGSGEDDTAGLPSDDSEDDDFNPGGADDDNVESGESSSDESDFSSASEDLGAIHNNTDDQYLGLPSDDSEDEDFAPNFLDAQDQPDEQEEGSSSDFTSASEDLHAVIENDEISSEDKNPKSPPELAQDCEDIELVTGRRQQEKLDYKKLYDEAYGNNSTDSSDDEDWRDAVTPKKRKNNTENPSNSSKGEEYSVTPKRRRYGPRNVSPLVKDTQAGTGGPSEVTRYTINFTPLDKDTQAATGGPSKVTRNSKNVSPLAKDTQVATPEPSKVTRSTRSSSKPPPSPEIGVSNDSQTPEKSSGAKTIQRSSYSKLGEDAIQILNASFEKNKYPDRSTKQKLAEELGISPEKVSKWFGNTRRAVNHSATGDGSSSGVATRGRRKI